MIISNADNFFFKSKQIFTKGKKGKSVSSN